MKFVFWDNPVTDKNGATVYPGYTDYGTQSAWDRFAVPDAGGYLPGVVEVNCHRFKDLDKKKQKGEDGARLTLHGLEPALVEIRVVIWTAQQLQDLGDMWSLMFTRENKSFDVNHPVLDFHQVSQLVFQSGEGPLPGPFVKSRVFNIHAVEWTPKKKKDKTQTVVAPVGSLFDRAKALGNFGNYEKPGTNPKNTGPLERLDE